MVSSERVNIFGDIVGINPRDIGIFVEVTNHSYGGSYPNCEEDLPDEEVVRKTRELLAKGGIPDSSPVTLCSTTQERAIQILQECNLHWRQNGAGLYWIIDRNPHAFLKVVKSVRSNSGLQADLLRSITLVELSAPQAFDYKDTVTRIRVVAFPSTPFRFPVHPTPDS